MNINPFGNSNPMGWRDAVELSAILTAASFFTVFLLPYSYAGVREGVGDFLFNVVKFVGASFFTNFASLAGLAQVTKGKEGEKTQAPEVPVEAEKAA